MVRNNKQKTPPPSQISSLRLLGDDEKRRKKEKKSDDAINENSDMRRDGLAHIQRELRTYSAVKSGLCVDEMQLK